MQNDYFSIDFQIPLPSKMIKSKVIHKMEANDRKTNSKEIAHCSVLSSVVCTTLHAYVCDLSLENHSESHISCFRNVSLKRFNQFGYMFNYICWEGMKLHMNFYNN